LETDGPATISRDICSSRPAKTLNSTFDGIFCSKLATSASEVTTLWRYTNLFIIIIIIIRTYRRGPKCQKPRVVNAAVHVHSKTLSQIKSNFSVASFEQNNTIKSFKQHI